MPPPPQQQRAPGGVPAGAAPAQTVIVQYMNPPNFGHNPVSLKNTLTFKQELVSLFFGTTCSMFYKKQL